MAWDQGVASSLWQCGIPNFNLGSLFTYFESLQETGRNSGRVKARKKALFEEASSTAQTIAKGIDTDSLIKTSAKDFLKTVAISEQAKERKALEHYREKIKNALPQDTELDTVLASFTPDLLKNTRELQTVYQRIIKYVTVLRVGAKEFNNRLETFRHHSNNSTLEDLHHDDFRMRLKGELHAIENSVVGAATKQQKDSDEVYASLLRQAVGKYMVSRNILSRCKDGESIVAITAAIAMDIENYMDNELRNLKGTDLRKYNGEEIRTIVKDRMMAFVDDTDREETRLEKAINTNSQELNDILLAMKETLGINSGGRLTAKKRSDNYDAQRRKRDSIINKLTSSTGGKLSGQRLQELFKVTFTDTTSNTLHGNLFEALQVVLQQHAIKVSGSAAVDTLTLGEISIKPNIYLDTNKLMDYVRSIGSTFSEYATLQHQNRFDDMTTRYEDMNKKANQATKDINTLLLKMKEAGLDAEDIFIYHDSLKLYKTMESSEGGTSNFHGRDIQILSYIDELYSLHDMKDLALMQKDSLQFLALNIADGAVGSKYKDVLSNYFGIFAGLLMFGDIQNIAQEAVTKINENATEPQAYNIHLYNLNGFYVPASMILFATYQALEEADEMLQRRWGADVYISTSRAANIITKWNAGEWRHGMHKYNSKGKLNSDWEEGQETYYSANEWARVGEAVSAGTTVRVQLLAAFAQIIEQIP